jgi:hypothetical protein
MRLMDPPWTLMSITLCWIYCLLELHLDHWLLGH